MSLSGLGLNSVRVATPDWIVQIDCDDDVHALMISADGSVALAEHHDEPEDGSSCQLARDVATTAVNVAPPIPAAVAGAVYFLRQARRSHPRGAWDDGHRWYPNEAEWRDCCGSIRAPSRAWPWSLMVHCRTAAQVAAFYGIDPKALRRCHRAISAVMGPPDSHRER